MSGGVAFYIREDIAGTFEPLFEFISDSIQALCLFSEKENLLLCVVYRQPDDKAHGHPSTSYEFKKMIEDLRESVSIYSIIAADLKKSIFAMMYYINKFIFHHNTNCNGDS